MNTKKKQASSLQVKWQQLSEKTVQLSLRERVIVTATIVVVVLVAWLQLYFTHYEKQMDHLAAQKATYLQDKVNQSQRLSELTVILDNDPNKALREEQGRLLDQLDGIKADIESRLSNLIAPEKMADVMREVLSDYKGLTLIRARNLPVEPLHVSESGQISEQNTPTQAAIFAHGFEMTLKGSYFQTIAFLQHLETMSGFYWRQLDYQVKDYPEAEISIQISTLSLDEDWIGV